MKFFIPAVACAVLAFGSAAHANDVDPFGFEKEHFAASRARADVVAEFKAAQAAGQLTAPGELGERFVETPSIKTRAQVVAETREARRLGLLSSYGELGPREATSDEERQIRMAGLRAVAATATAKRDAGHTGG